MEVFFLTGLAIAFVTSQLFIPREQHDARGVAILACLVAAVLIGWVAVQIGVPRLLAWVLATGGTLAVARIAIQRARRAVSHQRRTLINSTSGRRRGASF